VVEVEEKSLLINHDTSGNIYKKGYIIMSITEKTLETQTAVGEEQSSTRRGIKASPAQPTKNVHRDFGR